MSSLMRSLFCVLIFHCVVVMVFASPTLMSTAQLLRSRSRSQPAPSCASNQYRCRGNGRCIPGNRRCDGHPDCRYYRDDEEGCDCESGQFQCLNNKCIRNELRCDNFRDCPNGEDELHCRCPENKFMCASDGVCYPLGWKCNGVPECSDGSDEMGCVQSGLQEQSKKEKLKDALRNLLAELQSD